MLSRMLSNRWTAIVVLGLISLTTVAPAAHAGHGRGHGNKWRYVDAGPACGYGDHGTRVIVRERYYAPRYVDYGAPRVVVREQGSSFGPALAGFVGGLVLGTVISHPAPDHYCAPHPASTYYYDPYSDERFGSLDACYSHYIEHDCDHPLIVEQIDIRSGRCSGRFLYRDGDWHTYRGDWDDDSDHGRDRDGDDD